MIYRERKNAKIASRSSSVGWRPNHSRQPEGGDAPDPLQRMADLPFAAILESLGQAGNVCLPRLASHNGNGNFSWQASLGARRWAKDPAKVVEADGSRRRVAEELADGPDAWTQFAGWSPDGKQAIVSRGWQDPENAKWEDEHKTFRMSPEKWSLDTCLVDMPSGKIANVTLFYEKAGFSARVAWSYADRQIYTIGSTVLNDIYRNPRGQYDVQLRYRISSRYSITGSVRNVTREKEQFSHGVTGLLRTSRLLDRDYKLGVGVNF